MRYNVAFFIAYVGIGVTFSFASLENHHLGFLSVFGIPDSQYEGKVFRQLFSAIFDRFMISQS